MNTEREKLKKMVFLLFSFSRIDLIFIRLSLTQHDIIINYDKVVTKMVSCCYSHDIILVAIVMR